MKKIRLLIVCFAVLLLLPACRKTETTNEIVIKIKGLDREYDYFLLNDMHIFIGDDEVTPEYNELVASRINEFTYENLASSQNLDLWLSNLGKGYDGVILNADILDQLSAANLSHLKKVLSNVKVPYMYLRSDHDVATDWTTLSEAQRGEIDIINNEMGLNDEIYTFEENHFIIIGINMSWLNISESALNRIKDLFSKGKPVIIVTHVPYDSKVSDEISNISKEMKGGRVLLWGTGPENYYYPDSNMREYLDMVYSDSSPVVAVIGAHLHTDLSTMLTDTIPEYIISPGYSGTRTKLRIIAE